MPKLFIFVAENAEVAVVIRKEKRNKREFYQCIKWDMENNTFVEGQWLLNKQLFIEGCSISPDGKLFGWVYNRYWNCAETLAGISYVPNFTAELFGHGCGRWLLTSFDSNSRPFPDEFGFKQQGDVVIELSNLDRKSDAVSSGLKPSEFITKNGKHVSVIDYKILLDGIEIYNAENNVFVNREKIM